MAHRSIGQEQFGFASGSRGSSSLDELDGLIDWKPVAALVGPLYPAPKGEPGWPPLAMFKALLPSVWYDLCDVKLAEALDDRASFRRFCGFSRAEATPERTAPERTAFVRYRSVLVALGLDRAVFEAVTAQLKARAVTIKTGTLVDATVIASVSKDDADGRWVKHKGKPAVHGFKAHVGADADSTLVEKVSVTPANVNDGRAGPDALPDDPARCSPTVPIAVRISPRRFARGAARHASSPPACGRATRPRRPAACRPGTSRSTAFAPGSRRSSEHGSAATACDECDGAASPRPPPRSTSPPSPTTSSAPDRSSPPQADIATASTEWQPKPHIGRPPRTNSTTSTSTCSQVS